MSPPPATAFEAGVAQALEATGIRPTVASGTSAGAITGAALIRGWSAARTTELWCSLESRHVMRPRKDLHRLLAPSGLIMDPRELIDGRQYGGGVLAQNTPVTGALAYADDRVDGDGGGDLVERLTVLPDAPIVGLGDLLDSEPELARELADSGRELTIAALEERGWSS